jgi:putative ABC transport system ATP-binding protein
VRQVQATNLTKVFGRGENKVVALRDAGLSVDAGEVVALMGPSGSGKTTLLRAISLIDPPTRGRVEIAGEAVFDGDRVLTDDRLLRRRRMGVIFQAYNLIPFLTAAENVALVLTLNGVRNREAARRARELLERLDLCHRADTYPSTLSGGEQQRVAVARAVINDPSVILADEPTAALDTKRGMAVMELLRRLGREKGAAVIVVTHDERMIQGFDRVYHMTDGVVTVQHVVPKGAAAVYGAAT